MGQLFKSGLQPILMAGWVLLAAGCATPANTARPPGTAAAPAPAPQPAFDKRFVMAPQLERILHVVRVILGRGPDGYLKIQVTVQNTTPAPQSFDYRIEWFDAEGALLPAISGASHRWMLLGEEVSAIAATAPAPTAADFGIAFLPAPR